MHVVSTRAEIDGLFRDALKLKQQASATTELEERKRLLTQAEDLNKSGKEKLKEAEKMEGAAIDLSDAGMTKKKELEEEQVELIIQGLRL